MPQHQRESRNRLFVSVVILAVLVVTFPVVMMIDAGMNALDTEHSVFSGLTLIWIVLIGTNVCIGALLALMYWRSND